MTRSPVCPSALGGVLLFVATASLAHDFWIAPSDYTPQAISTVRLHLRVGDGFEGEAVRRRNESIRKFWAVGPDGEEVDVVAPEGMDPAGFLRVDAPGGWVAAYHSEPSPIELAADRFTSYLEDEGLEAIVERRAMLGESEAPGRERFSRCAKTFLRTEAATAPESAVGDFTAAVGLPLELVPESDPTAEPGGAVAFRLLFEGAPLAGALVGARHAASPEERRTVRTDVEGRAVLDIDQAGVWLVTAVHMVRAPEEVAAEWDSLWASVTFETAAAAH